MPRYLAIDADAGGLTVAAGTVRGAAVLLEQTLAWSESPQPLSPATAVPLGRKLAELLKQAGIAPAPALFVIGRDRVVLKELKHPPSPPQDEPAVVRYQAVKELTDSPDAGVLDYIPMGADAAGERRALVAFVNNDLYKAVLAFCDAAGLKIAGVTPRPFAAVAAAGRAVATGAVPAPDAPDAATAVVTLGDTAGEFTVVKSGLLRFSRFVSPMAFASEAALISEVRKNLNIYAAQSAGDAVQAVYVAEGEAGPGAWSGRLGASLPVPVYPFDPLAGSPAAERIPPKLRGRFAGVVGLLAVRAKGAAVPINFAQPRQPKAVASPHRNRTAVYGVLALLLLVGLGVGGFVMIRDAEGRAEAKKAQVVALDARMKDLEPNLKRLRAAEEFEATSVSWLDELYDLSYHFPDQSKIRLVEFVGTLLPPPKEKKPAATVPGQPTPTAGLPGQPTPVVAFVKKDPVPVGHAKIVVYAENIVLPQELQDSYARDKRYYTSVEKRMGQTVGGTGSASRLQQYQIEANVYRRRPIEYTAQLRVTLPKPVGDPARPAGPAGDPLDADDGDAQP